MFSYFIWLSLKIWQFPVNLFEISLYLTWGRSIIFIGQQKDANRSLTELSWNSPFIRNKQSREYMGRSDNVYIKIGLYWYWQVSREDVAHPLDKHHLRGWRSSLSDTSDQPVLVYLKRKKASLMICLREVEEKERG